MVKTEQLIIYAIIAYVGVKYILPELKKGGILPGSTPAAAATPSGPATATVPGTSASVQPGGNATVCNNGKCQTFTGPNLSVSCVDGRCTSHYASVVNWSY